MKIISIGTALGIILALGIVYWLHPLEKGGMLIVAVVSIGICNAVVVGISRLMGQEKRE